MAIKKEIDPTVPRKRRGRPPKNRNLEEALELPAKKKRIKPPPPPPPDEDEDDDNDDDSDDSDEIDDNEILAGLDPESKTQNRIVQNVLKRREEGGRVPWHGQDNIKYNCASEKCLSLFGAESEVEIVRERPSAHHITLSPLSKFPKWMDVYSFLKETQWDGSAQKYKIMVYSTGRSVAAVCYLTLDEDERRKLEWRKHWEHVRAGQTQAPVQEHVPSWQQQAVQQQPQAQQPAQQPAAPQPQSFQQPQPPSPSPFPQPPQPYNQPLPWQPQGPAWQPQGPQQPQWPGWPQSPQQPPFQPPFQQFAQEEDEDEDDEEVEDDEPNFQPPQRWQREDPKVAMLERNIHALTKQISKLQRSNQKEMAGANSQVAYQQQWQVWQMLTGMNQSLQAMSAQLEEAKKQATQQPPPPPPPPPPQSQMMTVDEIMKIVDERMRQPQQQQPPMGMQMPMGMGMGMQMPMMPPPPPPEPTDSLGEIKRTVKQVADLRKMFEDLQPQQPQPPAWMQQMPPAPQAMVQSETKAEDGSPLKVFEMGPFRYVTDKEGKAVDFFTMMMLNADNVKSWVEPGLKAFGELREQVKDARKKNEMQDTLRMFEQMSNQVMHNQQLQAQQIEQLNQRLAPSQSTIEALQSGNVEVLSSPPSIKKREPQPGPIAKAIVPSGQRKSLLDGLANAQRALQSKKQ